MQRAIEGEEARSLIKLMGPAFAAPEQRAVPQAVQRQAEPRLVLDLASARHEGGVATYVEVINAQQGLLAADRQLSQLRGQRLLTAVFLIKALGGDWQSPGLAVAR